MTNDIQTERRVYLKRRMAELGHTCKTLAAAINRHANTVRNYVAGRTKIHETVIHRVKALKKPVA